jgi:hypothetical protein
MDVTTRFSNMAGTLKQEMTGQPTKITGKISAIKVKEIDADKESYVIKEYSPEL